MDFVRLLASMNYVNKQVSFQPARLPVYKLRIPEDRERGRSEHLLVQSLGAFKKTPTAYLRKEFDKPFYFTAISKGMGDPVLGQGEPVRLMSYKKYDIDVWIGADSRGEFKEKFLKGVALLNADTGECFGSITPEFMMDHALSLEDIEVGRGVRVDGTTFEVISAQEAADFKCLEIPDRLPELHDKARLRALASTLHRTKRTKRTATTCARCGRKNLTRTIPVRLRNGSTAYLGSGCARHVKIK